MIHDTQLFDGKMSQPYLDAEDGNTLADEIQNTSSSLEGISLAYEELFDDGNGEDRPCYLPDKPSDSLASGHDDEHAEAHLTNDSGVTETRHSSETNGTSLFSEKQADGSEPEVAEYSSRAADNPGPVSTEDNPDSPPVQEGDKDTDGGNDHDNNHDLKRRGLQEDNQEVEPCLPEGVADSTTEIVLADEVQVSESESGREEVGENGATQGYRDELRPDVSGYVAGSGSSSATSLWGESELGVAAQIGSENNMDTSTLKKTARKRYPDEDDTSAAWRKHKKHFFILSHAGKPIYSRYGDEHKLAGFSATLQAIMSFVENSGDCIRYVRAGDHQIVFLVKGPIYLVSISVTDEPVQALRGQLELLHGQLLLILTKSVEKCFVKNANFDMRPLLGGTEAVFSSLIRSFSWNPASFLHSYTCLPLAHTARQAAGAALQDIADSDLLFALLLSESKVISFIGVQKASLHPDDIFLLSNFVSSHESFRTTESFSPVCLPDYNATAFLYAYVYYLDINTCLILITSNPDAFFHLKECRARVESFLIETHVLRDISNSVLKGGLRVENLPGDTAYGSLARSNRPGNNPDKRPSDPAAASRLKVGVGGTAGLWHFMYRSVYLDQYVASEFSAPLQTKQAQKSLFCAYKRLYASLHGGHGGSHQMQYRRDDNFVLLAWSTADFEFFAAFDPLAEKSSAIAICNRVCQWIRDVESDVFYLGASPFNW